MLFVLCTVGCNKISAKSDITKEEAFKIYRNTITSFVPELMTEPKQCDVNIKTRDEVTFLTENFVRNTSVKIKSQNKDGKLQYYLLNEFPEANKIDFYCIDNDKFYAALFSSDTKGALQEWPYSRMPTLLLPYLNAPFFEKTAIKSFKTKKADNDTKLIFIIDGSNMEYGYSQRVMREINAGDNDKLDDVEIVLTIDENQVPKTMSTKISMSIFNDENELHAQKILNSDFTFNDFHAVSFELNDVLSEYDFKL